MGFRLNRTYVLEFEGDMEGAEVTIRSTSVAVMLAVRAATTSEEVMELLAEHLLSWNFDDEDGETLPLTIEGLASLEPVVVSAIVREWTKAANGVTAPLDVTTLADSKALEETLPMQ